MEKNEGIKATINSKTFLVAFVIGAILAFVVLQHPYFQVYIHAEAMASLEYQVCHDNMRFMENAYRLCATTKEELQTPLLKPPVIEPDKLALLMTSLVTNKCLQEVPTHRNSKITKYENCTIFLPTKDEEKLGRFFCFEHGFTTPPPKGVKEDATPFEQLKQFGITDKTLLTKCMKTRISYK